MMNSRRNFLRQSIAVTAGFTGLSRFLSAQAAPPDNGPILSGQEWLELPPGFESRIISASGDEMSDGLLVPGRADGMAAFASGRNVVIIRNHENSPGESKDGAFGRNNERLSKLGKEYFYDFGAGKRPSMGGTTTVVYDEKKRIVIRQFMSLAGTNRNCAGGPTPWNSWITCEENVDLKGETAEADHGYNFEVPASASGPVLPVPLKAMGRFNHEAVCVDPRTGIVYQTEDRGDGLIYRFIPVSKEKLHLGGKLQALAIKGNKSFDTRNWEVQNLRQGEVLEVEWIDLEEVESPADDLRHRGFGAGAAVFARGEGMWFGKGEVYFACTNGGKKKAGQVFRYVPSPAEGSTAETRSPGKLSLFAEPNNTEILKYCDNLTVSPWGDVILVEDAANSFIRGITPQGKIYNIGRNAGSNSELAGVCFSPSGETMFVNVQNQGVTFAITGPWQMLRQQ